MSLSKFISLSTYRKNAQTAALTKLTIQACVALAFDSGQLNAKKQTTAITRDCTRPPKETKTMTIYTFEDTDGIEQSFSTLDPNEADRYAAEHDYMAVANEYEWSDSEIFKDYRPENPNDIEERN